VRSSNAGSSAWYSRIDWYAAAEALIGSVGFGIPMVIDGGTREAVEFVARHPPTSP
jgi:hypothetical protein